MARVDIYACDWCKREVRPQHWTENVNRVSFKSEGGGAQFSSGTGAPVELCRTCGDKLGDAITAVYKQVSPEVAK